MVLKEFKKLEDINIDKNINISKNNIPENIKSKIDEILFNNLLSYALTMIEFNIEKKYIIKIIDDIFYRYSFQENKIELIYDSVCSSREELKAIKEKIKNDKELSGSILNKNLIEFNSIKGEQDEEEDFEEDEDKFNNNKKSIIKGTSNYEYLKKYINL